MNVTISKTVRVYYPKHEGACNYPSIAPESKKNHNNTTVLKKCDRALKKRRKFPHKKTINRSSRCQRKTLCSIRIEQGIRQVPFSYRRFFVELKQRNDEGTMHLFLMP